jgi:ribosomal protein L4
MHCVVVALCRAVMSCAGRLTSLVAFAAAQHKTRDLVDTLAERELTSTSILLVDTVLCDNLVLASRNMKRFRVLPASVRAMHSLPLRIVSFGVLRNG